MACFINSFTSISRRNLEEIKVSGSNVSLSDLRIANINNLIEDSSNGYTEWTIDRNSGVKEGDLILFMCSASSKHNLGMLRSYLKSELNSSELTYINDLYNTYDKYAGEIISIGIVKSIPNTPDRLEYAIIEPLIRLNNPIPYEAIDTLVSVNKYGSMTKIETGVSEKIYKLIIELNPSLDLSVFNISTEKAIQNKTNTSSNKTKKNGIAAQKEWIVPCNTDYYEISNALSALKIIDWKQPVQMNNANVGDLVYLYCKPSGKTGSILYKGAILEINKFENIIDDSQFSADHQVDSGRCCSIAMFRVYELGDDLSYAKLKEAGLKSRLQGPVVVKGELADYLHSCDERQRQIDHIEGTKSDECLVPFPIDVNEITSNSKHSNDDLRADIQNGKRTAWLLAPGEKGCMMDRFVEEGIAAIDWWSFQFGDLTRFESKEQINDYMKYLAHTDHAFMNDSLCLYQFSHEIKVGDVLFCKAGLTELIGVGIVSSPYFHSNSDELGKFSKRYNCFFDTYKHRIGVEWVSLEKRITDFKLQLKTLTKLKPDTADKLFDLYGDIDLNHCLVPLDDTHTDEEKIKHAESLDINDLKVLAQKQSKKKPKEVTSTVIQKVRDPYIAEYARRRADGICQLCGNPAPFNRSDGTPYLESHHIDWLANGGEDSIENTVALCPNCHRKMHIVGDPEDVDWLKSANKKLNNQ